MLDNSTQQGSSTKMEARTGTFHEPSSSSDKAGVQRGSNPDPSSGVASQIEEFRSAREEGALGQRGPVDAQTHTRSQSDPSVVSLKERGEDATKSNLHRRQHSDVLPMQRADTNGDRNSWKEAQPSLEPVLHPKLMSSSSRTKTNQYGAPQKTIRSNHEDPNASVTIEELRRTPEGMTTVHRYIRGRLLGKGGFAKVYMCTSCDTQKAYAVKVVPKANLVKTRARQKLQAEIKIHRTLKHRFICEYKHFFEDKTNCYILLELCENQSMNELIKRRKRLTEPEVVYYFLQLIEGTMYMHSNQVIHRDLKLGNLFLNRKLEIKIGDLGLAAKLSNTEDRRKTICGTPNYIAPEIIDGNKDGRGHSFPVDIWSMGVILYTLLIGRPPYESKDVKSTYQRILRNEYSFPSHVDISHHARDLIGAMLKSKPSDRPSLESVREHMFFTRWGTRLLPSLPSRCTHMEPHWEKEPDGTLKARFNEVSRTGLKKKKHDDATSTDQRKPLSTRDQNQLQGHSGDRGAKELQRVRNRILHGSAGKPEEKTQRNERAGQKAVSFKVYDENKVPCDGQLEEREQSDTNGRVAKMGEYSSSKPSAVEQLTSRISKVSLRDAPSLNGGDPGTMVNSKEPLSKMVPPKKSLPGSTADRDLSSLRRMHERISEGLDTMGTREPPAEDQETEGSEALAPVSVWVTRYVDYTSKYGLGFLLNDGSAGVYFNDSTKAVMSPAGDTFHYVERRRSPNADTKQGDPNCSEYSLVTYPESLQKKVTLLKHFCGYLIEQEQKTSVAEEAPIADADAAETCGLVFLKKWVRTRHAILFRLSNDTVQVVFHDHTEVLLSSKGNGVTYVDKSGNRDTTSLVGVFLDPQEERVKRLRYSRDIIQQLIRGSTS